VGAAAPVAVAAVLALLLLVPAVAFAGGQGESATVESAVEGLTPPDEILVTPDWVAERSNEIVLIDYARERAAFNQGHIPGAAYLPREVTWDTVDGLSGMLPAPETVAGDLSEVGVTHDTPVVVYDAGNGLWASRLFWALEYLGHKDVHLLDGGVVAWQQAGYELTNEVTVPERTDFEPRLREDLLASQQYVLENLENEDFAVIDARSPAEYTGETKRSDRNGHIPGAVNVNWTNNLPDGDGGSFLPVTELTSIYEEALDNADGPAVTLCQTGVRGAHTYVALRVLGHENPRLYDGSWEEWGNDPDTPIARPQQ
jgi:thiosulfate/3-mercaptopyruvate sulfurtransferase